jgi:hypothetical protein
MSRFIIAFCVLAFAIAAPTSYTDIDAIVPEMLETSATPSQVSALQSQFDMLQTQMKAGVEVTPAVIKVIDSMIKLVEDEIEPAIKDAHKSDQELVNTSMTTVKDLNDETAQVKNSLNQRESNLRATITKHNDLAKQLSAAASTHSTSLTHYETTVKSKTNKCCEKRNAQVPDIEYTPAYAKCDYTESTAVECLEFADAAVDTAINAKFTAGHAEYVKLKASCETQTTAVTTAGTTMRTNDGACDAMVVRVKTEADIVTETLPTLKKDWTDAHTSYKAQYKKFLDAYNVVEADVKKQEADRKNEWDSTQQIKCLLVHYKEGGTFDDAAVTACNGVINHEHLVIKYPEVVKLTLWVLGDFDALDNTSASEATCLRVETANEDADMDENCKIAEPNPIPVCTHPEPKEDEDEDGNPGNWQ